MFHARLHRITTCYEVQKSVVRRVQTTTCHLWACASISSVWYGTNRHEVCQVAGTWPILLRVFNNSCESRHRSPASPRAADDIKTMLRRLGNGKLFRFTPLDQDRHQAVLTTVASGYRRHAGKRPLIFGDLHLPLEFNRVDVDSIDGLPAAKGR